MLYKPYKELVQSETTKSSFIQDKINNLEKYIEFIYSSTKTKLFNLLPYYKLIWPNGEQDSQFWKEVAVVFVDAKYNTKTLCNEYLISIYQGGPSYKPYFITIDVWEQAIISSNNKIVVIYIIGELEVLVWFIRI